MKSAGEVFPNPKNRGEWAEMRFMARAAEQGFRVSKPWGDSARYDFAVEENGRQDRRGIVKERSGIHVAVLELLVDLSVQPITARPGENADVRSAIGPLACIVHGGIDCNLLDGLGRRSGESLSNCPIHRSAGLDGAARTEIFADVEDEAVLANRAGGVAVEQIVGADAVQ